MCFTWSRSCVARCLSAQEWSDVCCRGIRSAHVYILVYDICCFDSFEYVKTMRQQILETRYVMEYLLDSRFIPSHLYIFAPFSSSCYALSAYAFSLFFSVLLYLPHVSHPSFSSMFDGCCNYTQKVRHFCNHGLPAHWVISSSFGSKSTEMTSFLLCWLQRSSSKINSKDLFLCTSSSFDDEA